MAKIIVKDGNKYRVEGAPGFETFYWLEKVEEVKPIIEEEKPKKKKKIIDEIKNDTLES